MATYNTGSGSSYNGSVGSHGTNVYTTNSVGSWTHQSSANMTMKKDSIEFSTHNTVTAGDIKFDLTAGSIMVFDGVSWLAVTDGVAEKTQIEKIIDELKANYPEVLFDLIMKDLI